MDKRDHVAACNMNDESRALALALLQDHVPVIIHCGRSEQARAVMASIEECDCGNPRTHYYLHVHVQNGDEAARLGPMFMDDPGELLMQVPYHVEYVDKFTLAAPLN